MKKKVLLYSRFERFWHWSQAILIIFLGITGFEIHSSYTLFNYENAVTWHNLAAWAFIVLIIFAVFWHFITGQWRQYIPTKKNLKAQIDYYLLGILKKAPHPTKKTVLSKLNPLQILVYLALNLLVIPVVVLSGLLYMFFRYPENPFGFFSLTNISFFHTAGAFLLVTFLIIHVYLITTGHTVFSNLNAMVTGYEELDVDEDEEEIN